MAPDDSGLGAAGRGSLPGIVNPPRALGTEDAERLRRAGGLGQNPETTVLVFIVLVASITYYFVNWALLSFVREVGQGPGRGRPAANARALFRTAALVPIGRAVGVSHRRECGHGGTDRRAGAWAAGVHGEVSSTAMETERVSDDTPPGAFAAGDRRPPEDQEMLRDAIRFMEEELGMASVGVPRTYTGAKRRYEELIAKVRPPTPGQVARINRLVSDVGGTVSGKLHSRGHASQMIRELRELRKRMRADAGPKARGGGPVAAAGVSAGALVSLLLWSDTLSAWLILIGSLVFVVGGAFYVLGLWKETFSILLGSRPRGD